MRISVTSGKGGVGKTNIVVNLASLLASIDRRVLVMDCDLGLANIDILLGIAPEKNLYDVVRGDVSIEEVVVKTEAGFDLLPAASGVAEMVNIAPEQQFKLVSGFSDLFHNYEFILLDTGAGIASTVIRFNLTAQENIIVLTPEPTSITDAYALMKILKSKSEGTPTFHLLTNMVKDAKEGREVYSNLARVAKQFLKVETDYLGHIVDDQAVRRSVAGQKAFARAFPKAPATRCLKEIIKNIASWSSRDSEDFSGFFPED